MKTRLLALLIFCIVTLPVCAQSGWNGGSKPAGYAPLGLPAPGTSGNVLTSNGSKWTSAAAASAGFGVKTVTTDTTLTSSDGRFVIIDTTAGTVNVTVPLASTESGLQRTFVVTGSSINVANVIRQSTDTFGSAATTLSFSGIGTTMNILSDGVSTWRQIGHMTKVYTGLSNGSVMQKIAGGVGGSAAGTSGQLYQSGGSAIGSWTSAPTLDHLAITTGTDVVGSVITGFNGGSADLEQWKRGSDGLLVCSIANGDGAITTLGDIRGATLRPSGAIVFNPGAGAIYRQVAANSFAGSDTIGGGGSVTVNNTQVASGSIIHITDTSATALGVAHEDKASRVASTSFKVIGTPGDTFDYTIDGTY